MAIISISLNDAEAESLKAQAKAEGVSVSQYVRQLMVPKTNKIRKCIREQKALPKSVAMSTMCMKKETYTHQEQKFVYIYDVNYVFVDDGTLYPINPGYAWENSKSSVGIQSILFAILCASPVGVYISNSLWDSIEETFQPYITGAEQEGTWVFKFNIFTFKRVYDTRTEMYSLQLVDRS